MKNNIIYRFEAIIFPSFYPNNVILFDVLQHEASFLIVVQIQPKGNISMAGTEHSFG